MDVLLVEDEPVLLEAMIEGLREALPQLRVMGAPSAEVAANLAVEHGVPALVISDLRLPGKSGVELAEELRRRRRDLSVLLISAVPEPIPEELARSGGRTSMMRKPFSLDQLVTTVTELLEFTPMPAPMPAPEPTPAPEPADVCRRIVERTPQALGAAVYDLSRGDLLGGSVAPDHAEAARAAGAVLRAFAEQVRAAGDGALEQAQLSTPELRIFVAGFHSGALALVLVVRRPDNLGMAWANLRRAVGELGAG